MPEHVVTRVMEILNTAGKCLKGAKLLVLGVAYKPNVQDTRESPAIEIIQLLESKGAKVSYCDPHVPVLKADGLEMESRELTPKLLKDSDCALIITHHKKFDYPSIVKNSRLVFDARNATKGCRDGAKNVFVL